MIKVFVTGAIISRGFDGAAALKFSENGDSVRFRIGEKVYDSRCENNTRWINYQVKAYEKPLVERLKKMNPKEGSYVNLCGRLDEDTWVDKETDEKNRMTVVILEDIEYASGGSGEKSDKQGAEKKEKSSDKGAEETSKPAKKESGSDNYSGFMPYGGESFFDT